MKENSSKKQIVCNLSEKDVQMLQMIPIDEQTGISKLVLRKCNIRELYLSTLERLQNLIELDLSENRISKLWPTLFKANKRLQKLNLNSNWFERLGYENEFSYLRELRELSVANNSLRNLAEKSFDSLANLTDLNLQENVLNVVKMSMVFRNLRLKTLDLNSNRICYVHNFRFADQFEEHEFDQIANSTIFSKMAPNIRTVLYNSFNFRRSRKPNEANKLTGVLRELKRLDLSGNNLMFLPNNLLNENCVLDMLDLSANTFKAMPSEILNVWQIRTLNLSGNPIETIESPFFPKLSKIRTLRLNNLCTKWKKVPKFDQFGCLRTLYLDDNEIEFLEIYSFWPLIALKKLSLRNNRFGNFQYAFPDFRQLTDPQLIASHMFELPIFPDNNRLKSLRLNQCRIQTLPVKIVINLTNLKRLNLRDNQLIVLLPTIFYPLVNIERIYLDNNFLTNLTVNVFQANTKLKILTFTNNLMDFFDVGFLEYLNNMTLLCLDRNVTFDKSIISSRIQVSHDFVDAIF